MGNNAIQVDLALRGGQKESLLVGSANPTGVSYYMMPLSGPHKGAVLTVAKASVDFFGSELSEFRAEHFVQFDLKSVDEIKIVLSAPFVKEREIGIGERTWIAKRNVAEDFQFWNGGFIDQPVERLSSEFMRRLLGRYLALKSKGYKGVVEISDTQAGLESPIVSAVLKGAGVNVEVNIGAAVTDGLRYFSVNGLTERVIARDGLLEDYNFSLSQVRNPRLLDFIENTSGLIRLKMKFKEEDLSLLHDNRWTWNGVEVSESTIQPLLEHASEFRVIEWRDDDSDWSFSPGLDNVGVKTLRIEHDLGVVSLGIW